MNSTDYALIISKANNIRSVVSIINHNPTECDELAGQYAFESALVTGYDVTEAEIEQHLEALIEHGAEFDLAYASAIAIRLDEEHRLKTWRGLE